MPDVYEGDRPYIFVGYAHADHDAVLPIICALVREGYRVWYDDGIELAEDYPDYIADHVYGCACFVALFSAAALESRWCKQETNYALDLDKTMLPVYLEDVELPRGLQMRLGSTQALYRSDYGTDEEFFRKLFRARRLYSCLSDKGRRRRGAKPRDTRPTATVPTTSGRAAGPSVDQTAVAWHESVIAMEPKRAFADYSWVELKELSRMVAAAQSNEAGLAIAEAYHLVDQDGRLRGDEKPFTLKDGTKTSVRILDFRHDDLVAGGKAGISFEFADVPARHRMNPTDTNEGGWERSEMRRWLNDEFLKLLPDDLRANVAEASKRTNNAGEVMRANDISVVTGTTDRLWLHSMPEVYGKFAEQGENVPWSSATYDAEGIQYKLYADKGVSTENYVFCSKDGADSWWWLRSPNAGDSLGFLSVRVGGGWGWHDDAYDDWGVSPGFCF